MSTAEYQLVQDKTYSKACKNLPKNIKNKVLDSAQKLVLNPKAKGLHIEKLNANDVYSLRVDDNYRLIFQWPNQSNLIFLQFVDTHDNAYTWADKHVSGINPVTGGREVKRVVPEKITQDPNTALSYSRLHKLWDKHLQEMGIPEEFWPVLRTRVFTKQQLAVFKDKVPEPAYATLEYILSGTDVEDAMQLYRNVFSSPLDLSGITITSTLTQTPLFESVSDNDLLMLGIPYEYLERVRLIKSDEELTSLDGSLPDIAMQSLYALRNGQSVDHIFNQSFKSSKPVDEDDYEKAMANPITLAECATISNTEALRAIMDYPDELWRTFLHPVQQTLVQTDFNGPVRVTGCAGTGKTIVIIHRAKRLAAQCPAGKCVLVTTFNKTLADDIEKRLGLLCTKDEMSRILVKNFDKLTFDLLKEHKNLRLEYAGLKKIWEKALKNTDKESRFSPDFCEEEWELVIQDQNIHTLEEYQAAARTGRGKQFDRKSREEIWNVFKEFLRICQARNVVDICTAQHMLVQVFQEKPELCIYQHILVDECQDFKASTFRMLRAMAGNEHRNDIYLSGDSKQRIYRSHTSLKNCGISISNRSRELQLNYRSTVEISEMAKRIQQRFKYDDLDGGDDNSDKCVCLFHGPKPQIHGFVNFVDEFRAVAADISKAIEVGFSEKEICIVARTHKLLYRFEKEFNKIGVVCLKLTNEQPNSPELPGIRLATMHRVKGMEFTCMYVVSVNDDVLPDKSAMEKAAEDDNTEDVLKQEANCLAVAITRAKKYVWISYFGSPSMYLANV
ncbi:MAG: UvrD-helicase domain-containing protein [Clostridia bacterium]|nr:UvrD-helicase domain-containing protein [Clostridia bacterium]